MEYMGANIKYEKVTILILVDGFLQYVNTFEYTDKVLSQSLF